jgi:hypothetical protein
MIFLTIHYTKVNTIKLRLKRAFPGDVMSGDMEEMNVRPFNCTSALYFFRGQTRLDLQFCARDNSVSSFFSPTKGYTCHSGEL